MKQKQTELILRIDKNGYMVKIKGFKGFDKDLKCRGFQYEVGRDYMQSGVIRRCDSGFHFCEHPLRVFEYYKPSDSRYCEVEGEGKMDKDDSKVAVSHIHIGKELGLNEMVNAAVKLIIEKAKGDYSVATNTGNCSVTTNSGYCSAATNTGDYSVATNSGDYSVATNTGNCSVTTNSGYCSAATNTGDYSVATNSGDYSVATNSGNDSAATNTGNCSAATNTGNCSVATNTGNDSAATVSGKDSVAIVTGKGCKAAGAIGCWLVLTERDKKMCIVGMKAVIVDGIQIKAGVYYSLKSGEIIEVD